MHKSKKVDDLELLIKKSNKQIITCNENDSVIFGICKKKSKSNKFDAIGTYYIIDKSKLLNFKDSPWLRM